MTGAAAASPASRPDARTWKFWGSLAWAVVIFLAMTAAEFAVLFALLHARDPDGETNFTDFERLSSDGVAVALNVIAVAPVTVAVVAVAVRLTRTSLAEYLALRWFARRDLWLGLICLLAYGLAVDATAWLSGHPIEPAFVLDTLRTAGAAGALPLFVLAVAVVAPFSEELAVRGFLYRGFAASWLGSTGAILLTSALWALVHLQYDWFFIGEVFGVGLILGWMRRRSDSTWLTMILHGAYNLMALAEGMLLS
jgi:membrane protease YdiL (CAAX protease family)